MEDKLTRSWISNCNKAQLEIYLREFDIKPETRCEDMRKQMSELIKSGAHSEETTRRLQDLAQKHARTPSPAPDGMEKNQNLLQIPDKQETSNGKPAPEPRKTDKVATMGVIRSWGEFYDGTGDPTEFIPRMEELAKAYGIELDHAAGAMVILLRDCALDWWHTHPTPMPSWENFKKEFLGYYRPTDHEERAMENITRRHQGTNEPAKDYARELRKIMRFTTLTEGKN
uniref:Uncharacterized protein LOC108043156 n=1 Tax=Drosophila rhopaloa TaxID=1041015 RepID=A0A6P4EGC0_DRORH